MVDIPSIIDPQHFAVASQVLSYTASLCAKENIKFDLFPTKLSIR